MGVPAGTDSATPTECPQPGIGALSRYFLQLGALGFGGPVALANAMRRDLVEQRGWLSTAEYDEGLAIATACPGPLAYQLAVYCGYIRCGVAGGLAVALAFAAAPFFLVTAAAALYVRYSGNTLLHDLFAGIGPVVIALILKAVFNLARKTLKTERLAWLFALVALGLTVVLQRELIALFLVTGMLGLFLFAPPAAPEANIAAGSAPPSSPKPAALGVLPLFAGKLPGLFWFFFKTGLLVFGSGLVIVPFLRAYVVNQYHWLDERQFLDAVAIGMISPGPVVITATFVGYLLDGFGGALAATAGIFTPPILFTLLATPLLRRHRRNRRLQGFIRGITVAVVGVLAGTGVLLMQDVLIDGPRLLLAALTLAILLRWQKIPEPLLVLAGALIGLLLHSSR